MGLQVVEEQQAMILGYKDKAKDLQTEVGGRPAAT